MRRVLPLCLLAIVLAGASQARAQQAYAGQTLKVALPPGFCVVGTSPMEQELLQMQRHNTAPAGELAQMAAPCDQLRAWLKGSTDSFTRWTQILVLKSKGQIKPISMSRGEFAKQLAGTKTATLESLNARMRDHLAKNQTTSALTGVEPLGADANASYTMMRGKAAVAGEGYSFNALNAITVLNKLPVGIYAFEIPGTRGPDIAKTLQGHLQAMLAANP